MKPLLLHQSTRQALDNFIGQPSHGLLIVAPRGSGKAAVAEMIAASLLQTTPAKLTSHPYFKHVTALDGKTIPIDDIRQIIHFTILKTATKSPVGRVVIIEDSQLMPTKAQNALLKTIEEPPVGTVIILTATSKVSLLPTICSRIQEINLQLADRKSIMEYFEGQDYSPAAIERALLVSGGLLGLMKSLLDEDKDHPLVKATAIARTILQKLTFERIAMIDDLSKDKQLCFDVLFTLGQMASITLQQGGKSSAVVRRWQRILSASHTANKQLLANAQTKLVLLNFMLSL